MNSNMRSYLRMMLFALGLLAGVQIPGLIDLYYQRLDARLQQASLSLAPFQETADQHFDGDLTALVNHYRTNPDPVFAKDAASLQLLVSQRQTLQQESVYKNAPWYRQLSHLLLRAEPQLNETPLRQLVAQHYPIEYFQPDTANRDWLILVGLVLAAVPIIIVCGLWFLRPCPASSRRSPRVRGELPAVIS